MTKLTVQIGQTEPFDVQPDVFVDRWGYGGCAFACISDVVHAL